jgi:hypothetical protein
MVFYDDEYTDPSHAMSSPDGLVVLGVMLEVGYSMDHNFILQMALVVFKNKLILFKKLNMWENERWHYMLLYFMQR